MLNLKDYTYTFFQSNQETNRLESVGGFYTKSEAQDWAATNGWNKSDVEKVEYNLGSFWIVYCYHHQLHLNTKGEVIHFAKKEKTLNVSPSDFKKTCDNLKISLKEIADKTGISPYQVSRWIRNKNHTLKPEDLQKLFQFVNNY